MIRRIYPTLAAAIEVLKSSGYEMTKEPRVWRHVGDKTDVVNVLPLTDTYPIPTQVF